MSPRSPRLDCNPHSASRLRATASAKPVEQLEHPYVQDILIPGGTLPTGPLKSEIQHPFSRIHKKKKILQDPHERIQCHHGRHAAQQTSPVGFALVPERVKYTWVESTKRSVGFAQVPRTSFHTEIMHSYEILDSGDVRVDSGNPKVVERRGGSPRQEQPSPC